MTNVCCTLDPIRPNIGEVRDDMLSGNVEAAQGQEVNVEIENVDGVGGNRVEADEVVRKPKPAPRPYTPTRAEVYEPEVAHLPYSCWCKHCVWGEACVRHTKKN